MQFNPCIKHKLIRNSARHFAETELAPIAAEIDQQRIFPRDAINKMKALNYFGLQVPEEYGGAAWIPSAQPLSWRSSRACAPRLACV